MSRYTPDFWEVLPPGNEINPVIVSIEYKYQVTIFQSGNHIYFTGTQTATNKSSNSKTLHLLKAD